MSFKDESVTTPNFVTRDCCPLCGTKPIQRLFSRPFTDGAVFSFLQEYYEDRVEPSRLAGGHYQIDHCKECDFLYQVDVLGEAGMEELYERWISSEQSRERQVDKMQAQGVVLAAQAQTLSRLFDRPPKDIKVLDFGMGWGAWCLMARAHGFDVTGLEVSESRLRFAETQGTRSISKTIGLEASQDFVNCEQVLEHVPGPIDTLKEIFRCLVPGGVTRLSVPNGRGLLKRIRTGDWKLGNDQIHPLEHINCFTNASLKKAAVTAGFEWMPQPRIDYPTASPVQLVKNILLPSYLSFASVNLFFRKSV